MNRFFDALRELVWGVAKRFFVWAPFLALDAADAYNRWLKPLLPNTWQVELERWPDPTPYLLGLALFIAIGLAYHELRDKYLEISGEAPRLEHWRQLHTFAIWEASYLFAEREPTPPPASVAFHPLAYRYWNELQELRKRGGLKSAYVDDGKAYVSRDDLQEYANLIGERPRFLFDR